MLDAFSYYAINGHISWQSISSVIKVQKQTHWARHYIATQLYRLHSYTKQFPIQVVVTLQYGTLLQFCAACNMGGCMLVLCYVCYQCQFL